MSLQKMWTDLNNSQNEYDKGLAANLKGFCSKSCGLCAGIGHHAGQCPVIKQMNRAVANNPVMKKHWGTYKSANRTGGKQALIKK